MADNNSKEPPTAEQTALQSTSDHDLRSPYYCEENAWRLVYRHLHNNTIISSGWHYNVVFISNHHRCCVMFHQKAAEKEYVCWDYHVIVIRSRFDNDSIAKGTTQVLDVDTNLSPYPCPLGEYLDGSFPHCAAATAKNTTKISSSRMDQTILPMFRVIDASEYLERFYSDRSHMYKDGEWSVPPPEYLPIMNGLRFRGECGTGDGDGNSNNDCDEEKVSNLESYINMMSESCSTERRVGSRPLSLEEFRQRFS
ncbi:hypothetical protein ACHAXN_004080 [Cyclotella atomus]